MGESFQVVRVIGRGATAEVLEAFIVGARGFRRRVAIKRLLPEAADDEALFAAFIDEARIVSQLSHRNLVAIFDFGMLEGLPIQILELVDGLNLAEAVTRATAKGTPMPAELALYVTAEVARGLEAAHHARDADERELGIVHRDVAPKNVLISRAGDVKLSDFGIAFAKGRSQATKIGTAKGTASFMAPEQSHGAAVSPRTDVFGLGCVLHYLWVGESPLEDERARLEVYSGGAVRLDPRIPSDVIPILQRALATAPRNRFASAEELADACLAAARRRTNADLSRGLAGWIGHLREPSTPRPAAKLDALFDFELPEPGTRGEPEIHEATAELTGVTFEEATETTAREATLSRTGETKPLTRLAERTAGGDPLIGTTIHGARIVELIGRGSSTRVYRAIHEILGMELAIKVLQGSQLPPSAKQRLVRTAQALCRLRHPNLAEVRDCGITDRGLPFITMELVQGRTLATMLSREASPSPALALSIGRQIVAGLAELHRHGIVHRELEPSNVMVVTEAAGERVKLVGAGNIRETNATDDATGLTPPGGRIGPAKYVAPEQIRAPSTVGPRADLYSLGAILYELLAGRPPFLGDAQQILDAQLSGTPPPLPGTGPLETLALRLLAKDPADRPASAEEIRELLGAIEAEGGPRSRPDLRAPSIPAASRSAGFGAGSRSGLSIKLLPVGRSAPLLGIAILLGAVLVVASMLVTRILTEPRALPVAKTPLAPGPEPHRGEVPPLVATPLARPPPTSSATPPRASPGEAATPRATLRRSPPSRRPKSKQEIEARFRRALASSGVEAEDLEPAVLSTWRAALESGDPARMEQALEEAVPAIGRATLAPRRLLRRLEALSLALRRARGTLPENEIEALEQVYFSMRASYRPDLGLAERQRLAKDLDAAERELRTSTAGRL